MEVFYTDLLKSLQGIQPLQDLRFPCMPTVELVGEDTVVKRAEFETDHMVVLVETAADSVRCSLKFKTADALRAAYTRRLARSSVISFVRREPLKGHDVTLLFTATDSPQEVFQQAQQFIDACVGSTDALHLELQQRLVVAD